MSTPAARAAWIMRPTICGILPQLALPAALRCQISTGMWAFAADADGFVDGIENGVAFAAHVSGVDAAVGTGCAREGDELLGLCVGRGRILQRGGDADGAVAHGLADEGLHLGELGGRGLHVGVAEDHAANGGSADVAGRG